MRWLSRCKLPQLPCKQQPPPSTKISSTQSAISLATTSHLQRHRHLHPRVDQDREDHQEVLPHLMATQAGPDPHRDPQVGPQADPHRDPQADPQADPQEDPSTQEISEENGNHLALTKRCTLP